MSIVEEARTLAYNRGYNAAQEFNRTGIVIRNPYRFDPFRKEWERGFSNGIPIPQAIKNV